MRYDEEETMKEEKIETMKTDMKWEKREGGRGEREVRVIV